jgi:hypothetical protein
MGERLLISVRKFIMKFFLSLFFLIILKIARLYASITDAGLKKEYVKHQRFITTYYYLYPTV